MYGANDPRSTLAPAPGAENVQTSFKGAEIGRWYEEPPQVDSAVEQSWYMRGQSMLVAYTKAKPGCVLARDDQPDEYMVLLPAKEMVVEITAGSEKRTVEGHCVVVVPPGRSRIEPKAGGEIVRIFTTRSPDLNARSGNAESYAKEPDPNVKPFAAWPDPVGGFSIRVYSLDIPKETGRFGRLFRCSTLMINYIYPGGPRDTSNLSPHHHDDFEQGSLCLEGSYIHYLRWPWTTNKAAWRPDMAELCRAPSLCVIPPPSIHTSQSVGPLNVLIDIFAPPRADFSAKPGWVLNAADYPAPTTA
jgi:hypothetical protein